MSYAIISLGGKQYTVREGQRLLVDRLRHEEGKTFTPDVLLVGGDGDVKLAPTGVTVTARVVGDRLGEKIRIGKYRAKKGYKKHTGFRAKLSQIEIESIGGAKAKAAPKPAEKPARETAAAPKADIQPEALPSGYADLTIAGIKEQAASWQTSQLEAALEYERSASARKGAIAALEHALAESEKKEES